MELFHGNAVPPAGREAYRHTIRNHRNLIWVSSHVDKATFSETARAYNSIGHPPSRICASSQTSISIPHIFELPLKDHAKFGTGNPVSSEDCIFESMVR